MKTEPEDVFKEANRLDGISFFHFLSNDNVNIFS